MTPCYSDWHAELNVYNRRVRSSEFCLEFLVFSLSTSCPTSLVFDILSVCLLSVTASTQYLSELCGTGRGGEEGMWWSLQNQSETADFVLCLLLHFSYQVRLCGFRKNCAPAVFIWNKAIWCTGYRQAVRLVNGDVSTAEVVWLCVCV